MTDETSHRSFFPRSDGMWRANDQHTDTDQALIPGVAVSRREWLKLMGASLAMAGLSGCDLLEEEDIVPYVRARAAGTQGEARHYATATLLNGYARGVISTSYMGRPVKLEGNPQHPASLGATDTFGQGSILELWDPERSGMVRHGGIPSDWNALLEVLHVRRSGWENSREGSLRVLTETVSSPTLIAQLQALEQQYPGFRWHQFQPVNEDAVLAGSRLVFGEAVTPRWFFESADVVVSLECDFLGPGPDQVVQARRFMQYRRQGEDRRAMNRLYVLESIPSLTGAIADHRMALQPQRIQVWLRALAHILGAKMPAPPLRSEERQRITAIAEDLRSHSRRSLIVAGPSQPPEVHALTHWLNHRLGNVGRTVEYLPPVGQRVVNQRHSLRELLADIEKGEVDTLCIFGGNPVYSAPVDMDLEAALVSVPLSLHLSLYYDETSRKVDWHLPLAHELESWSDARSRDGTACLLQPLIEPLHDGFSPHRLLAVLAGQATTDPYSLIREYWKHQWPAEAFETRWQQALYEGVIADSAFTPKSVSPRDDLFDHLSPAPAAASALTLVLQPDPTVWDGRFANNAWLQELPKAMTQLTWDNAVTIAPALARQHGLRNGDRVVLRVGERNLDAAVWIAPGQAESVLGLTLGYGRTASGTVGNGRGFNAYRLRTSDSSWHIEGVELHRLEGTYRLATTQTHHDMHDREPVRRASLDEYRHHPDFATPKPEHHPSLYPEWEYPGHAWGMFINLNTCIGCNACTLACQAENNIPVVGKEEVRRGREMHWIRVDRYHEGPADNPKTFFQPVPCMHCEHAPCEVACPVDATVHDAEGLNVQVYNRCIGTRFCSNNCPYKVRRFNFLQYADRSNPSLAAQRNPEVTVRQRGVMEKCTYCIQRIERTRIQAEREDRTIRDGELLTACQQVCPTQSIVFGDINDPDSQVSRAKGSPLNYTLLAELNTRPRTTYGAVLRNPNPEMPEDGNT